MNEKIKYSNQQLSLASIKEAEFTEVEAQLKADISEAKEKSKTDGVVLVCHEPARKVLVPLFLEALRRYNLLQVFGDVVVAFTNSVKVAEKYADSGKVTSYR